MSPRIVETVRSEVQNLSSAFYKGPGIIFCPLFKFKIRNISEIFFNEEKNVILSESKLHKAKQNDHLS